MLTSITRQWNEAKSPESVLTIAVLPSPIGMMAWAVMLKGSPWG